MSIERDLSLVATGYGIDERWLLFGKPLCDVPPLAHHNLYLIERRAGVVANQHDHPGAIVTNRRDL